MDLNYLRRGSAGGLNTNFTTILNGIFVFSFFFIFFGCAHVTRQAPPNFNGSFSGVTDEGSNLNIIFQQEENRITGYGKLDSRSFSLSALASWHGPMSLVFEDGTRLNSHVTLSPDGESSTVGIAGQEVIVKRNAILLPESSGPFSGRYFTKSPNAIQLSLSQREGLIAGSGFVDGKPIAVVGRQIDLLRAQGVVLFSDESRIGIEVNLSEDGRRLEIIGVGSPFEMRRK